MLTNFQKVKEFHTTFGMSDPVLLTIPGPALERLRMKLIMEEITELVAEFGYDLRYTLNATPKTIEPANMVNVAKELADILYVVYGAAANFGIDLDAVFAEVHRSNMTKLDDNGKPIFREDGKILKGPNYESANIEKVLYGSKK